MIVLTTIGGRGVGSLEGGQPNFGCRGVVFGPSENNPCFSGFSTLRTSSHILRGERGGINGKKEKLS